MGELYATSFTGPDVVTTPAILALQGASNRTIQNLLRTASARWADAGTRVVGLVEMSECREQERWLQDLATGTRFELDQNLGSGSTACRLTGSGVAEACESVCRQIRSGCDVVVLNKFGKLESERGGLVAAFAAAVELDRPVLTAVSPALAPQWRRFAGPIAAFAPACHVSVEAWWRHVRTASRRQPSGALAAGVPEFEAIDARRHFSS